MTGNSTKTQIEVPLSIYEEWMEKNLSERELIHKQECHFNNAYRGVENTPPSLN